MDYLKAAINSIGELYKCTNISLSQADLDLLNSECSSIKPQPSIFDIMSSGELKLPSIDTIIASTNYEDAFEQFREINSGIVNIASTFFKAFFLGAEQGFHFLEPSCIISIFHKDIKSAYPGSSKEFIRFAETFWTLQILQNELFISHRNLYLTQLFEWICFNVSSIFFPSGGGHPQISQKRFIDAQKIILRKVGYHDIDAFIEGNPQLKNRIRSG